MPYFITDEAADCDGWATIKDDGEVIGCHDSKQDAIDQMVAVSIAENIEPGGERQNIKKTKYKRAEPDELKEGDFVSWNSSGGRARGRIEHIMREGTLGVPDSDFSIGASEDDPAALIRIWRPVEGGWQETETLVGHKFSTLTKIEPLEEPDEDRQIDLDVPQYIRDAAAKGLEYYAQGLAGDGLVSATVREARALARGEVSEDKVVRAAAWGARHAPDLDAPQNSNADNDEFPGAGAVAHYLWGINPLSPASARNWFERKSQQIQAERALGAPAFIANMRAKDSLGVDMKQAVEVREVQFSDIEMRQTEDAPGDVPMTFRGYAAVFNSPSEDMGFREYIKPGAFAKSLKARNSIRMFMNHNSDIVLASTRAKTLRLVEDEKGLLVDADLPDTTAGRDLSVLLQRGDVDSMSFGFSVPPKGETWSDDGSVRELNAVRLHEVSVVTGWPAYAATSASVRTFDVLAERTNTNADELAEAITLLENGAELDAARADLLAEVVSKLRKEPPMSLIGLKQKHLDLLAKSL